MRARIIAPGFFANEDLAELRAEVRVLFAGLWCAADREGRLEDRPRRLKLLLMPADDVDVDALLTQLADGGFIRRYEVEGAQFIQVVNFNKYQKPHPRETASVIPPEVDQGEPKDNLGKPKAHLGGAKVSLIGSPLDPVSRSGLLRSPEDEVPAQGQKAERRQDVSEADLGALEQQFPSLNVRREWAKASDWLKSNGRAKKDHLAFLRNWLRKAEDDERNRIHANGHALVAAGSRPSDRARDIFGAPS